jgi:predicted ATPase
MLRDKAEIVNLSSIDYRLLKSMGVSSYYYPTGSPEATKSIQEVWD